MGSESKVVEGEIVRSSGGDDGASFLAELDARNAIIDRIVNAAIRATHAGHWVDQNGKPWLTAAGAEVMALRCGVSSSDVSYVREDRNDDGGKHYIYIYTGKFHLGRGPRAHTIEAVGTCSSRDQFLGTNPKDGADTKELRDIDEGNIMKAAYSNLEVNGVSRILGVRGMTWVQLEALGIKQGDSAKITYAEGSKGGGKTKPAVFPYGENKGKTTAEVEDKDLTWWANRLADDLASTDPSKEKYKANSQKLLTAVKEEIAKRANAKAGTQANNTVKVGVWDRLKQFAGASGVSDDRLKALTKSVLKKETIVPGDLTEADFKLVADEIEAEKKRVETEKATAAANATGDKSADQKKAGF